MLVECGVASALPTKASKHPLVGSNDGTDGGNVTPRLEKERGELRKGIDSHVELPPPMWTVEQPSSSVTQIGTPLAKLDLAEELFNQSVGS